jgi:hypothetical protein
MPHTTVEEGTMISARFAVAFGLAALLTSCAKTQEPSASTVAQPANTPPPATTSSVAAAPAPVPQPATTGALASTDGEKSGTRIDITELKRTSGGTVNLKFVLVNNSDKRIGIAPEWLADHSTKDAYRNVSGIHLLDPTNKKKYFVVTDAEKNCVCSSNVADVEPGQKVSLWAKFPAPPADVQKVTIEIPHFQPIDDVQIQ